MTDPTLTEPYAPSGTPPAPPAAPPIAPAPPPQPGWDDEPARALLLASPRSYRSLVVGHPSRRLTMPERPVERRVTGDIPSTVRGDRAIACRNDCCNCCSPQDVAAEMQRVERERGREAA